MELKLFKTREEAKKEAERLGCKGTHIHREEGKKKFMPCSTHKQYEKHLNKGEESKEEIEELVDFDGTMNTSKIPILDPRTTAPGLSTMDKRVASGHQTQDPLMRGYRVYYGESVVREEDMEDAFGFEETKFMDAQDTIDYFVDELDFDENEAEGRASEMGKDPKLDKSSKFKNLKNFVMKGRLTEKEFTKEQIMKMAEDSLVLKSDSKDLTKKELSDDSVSPIIKRNIKALKNMASADGISVPQLIKMLKNE
jgi:hypothetical protein